MSKSKYKIFYKNQRQFYESYKKKNESQKQFYDRVYNNIDNIKNFYGLNATDLKIKSPRIENQQYSYVKISDPLLAMMLNSIVKNNIKNSNTNRENFSLKKYIEYKNYTLKEVSNLPNDIAIKIKDSSIYDYDYELTQFIDKFFEKIDEILNLIIVPNSMFSTISSNILSDLNLIINRIKFVLHSEKEIRMVECIRNNASSKFTGYSAEDFEEALKGLLFNQIIKLMNLEPTYKAFRDFMSLPSDEKYKMFLNIYSKGLYENIVNKANKNFELCNMYDNFEKYNTIDSIVKEEFLRLNDLNNTIYNNFDFEEYTNSTGIKLDKSTTKKDILCLLEQEELKRELLSSLKPNIYSLEYTDYLINQNPTQNSLKDFVSIYKKIAYDKFKLYLDSNKEYSNYDIYSEYEKIIDELDKKISLSEKSISIKIELANNSIGKNVFDSLKNILFGIYKYISLHISPSKNYNITTNLITHILKIINNKLTFEEGYCYICGYKFSQNSYNRIKDLISNCINDQELERSMFPKDILKFLDLFFLCDNILNCISSTSRVNYDTLAFINALNNRKVNDIRRMYEKGEINNIDMYLLISSNKKILNEILSYINLKNIEYNRKNKGTFDIYSKARINLEEVDRVGYDITIDDFCPKFNIFDIIFNDLKNMK